MGEFARFFSQKKGLSSVSFRKSRLNNSEKKISHQSPVTSHQLLRSLPWKNNFSFTANNAIKIADILYSFAVSRKKPKAEYLLTLQQEYKIRGKLFLSVDNQGRLVLSVGRWYGGNGSVAMTKQQAKKLAGYLFLWAGEKLISKRKVRVPAITKSILDINDTKGKDL